MLRWRLASAAIIVSVLLTLTWLDFRKVGGAEPGVWLMPVLLLVAGLGADEVLNLLRSRGHQPSWLATVGGSTNADNSDIRKDLQQSAVEVLKR